jgi:3-oxoacyl-[acyl-carrier protein] reductase
MKTLEGKTAIVTGSARGIGAAIAERLAADGAAIVVNYSKSAAAAESLAVRIREAGGRATVIKADVGDAAQAKSLVARTVDELGQLDILVNNAATVDQQPLGTTSYEGMRSHYATNVFGPLALVEAALPYLPSGGRVINITSIINLFPLPGMSVYSGTKGAIDAMTRVWAAELGPKGITVNAVAPGPVETDAMQRVVPDDVKAVFRARTPLGRIGRPSDVAGVVSFLASPDAAFVTGHVLFVSGGFVP